MKLVYIEWIDASSSLGWGNPDKDDTTTIRSTGWLVNKTKKTITLSTSQSEQGKFLDQINIPMSSMTKYRVLKEYPA